MLRLGYITRFRRLCENAYILNPKEKEEKTSCIQRDCTCFLPMHYRILMSQLACHMPTWKGRLDFWLFLLLGKWGQQEKFYSQALFLIRVFMYIQLMRLNCQKQLFIFLKNNPKSPKRKRSRRLKINSYFIKFRKKK